jgi:hypothetical protein
MIFIKWGLRAAPPRGARNMRYMCLLGAAGLLVAAGCSSDDPEIVATSDAFVAPVADFDVVPESALWWDGTYDPLTGVFVGQVTPGDGGADAGELDAGAVVPTATLPRPLSGILSAWRVLVQGNCIPSMAFVDSDQDKVPASYTATFNCPNQVVGGRTTTLTGTISIADADDNNKLSGFTVTFTNFNVVTVIGSLTRNRTVNGTATLTPSGTAFQSSTNLTILYDLSDQNGKRAQGTYTTMGQGIYTPDPAAGADTFALGTVNLTGQATLQRVINGANQTQTVVRQTNPNLHWNRSCRTQNADSLGYDSGTLLYQGSQGSQLKITFSGCDNPKIDTK